MCFMTMFSINITAQEVKQYDWTKVINAIIQVESEGNPNAYNPNGDCAGILQITPIVVKDANEYLKMKGINKHYTLRDRYNVEKSKEMFILIQERYNPKNNVEEAIRIWNGGCGYSKAKTEKYYRRVLSHLNESYE